MKDFLNKIKEMTGKAAGKIVMRFNSLSLGGKWDLLIVALTATWLGILVLGNIIYFPYSIPAWILFNIPLTALIASSIYYGLNPTDNKYTAWTVIAGYTIVGTLVTSIVFLVPAVLFFYTLPAVMMTFSMMTLANGSQSFKHNFDVMYNQEN